MISPVGVFPFLSQLCWNQLSWNKGTDGSTNPDFAGPAPTDSNGSPLMREGGG